MRKPAKEQAALWLEQATADLAAAQWASQGKFFANACFGAQQAAEKALKSVLYGAGERHVFGHSTLELAQRAAGLDARLGDEALLDACRRLDKHYLTTRYPNELPGSDPHALYTRGEAEQALSDARAVLDLCAAILAERFRG